MINCDWWQIATAVKCNIAWFKRKQQWHNQTQYVARAELGRLTALLEDMTVLLEYLDLLISVARYSKDLEGLGPPLAMPLKKRHGVWRDCIMRYTKANKSNFEKVKLWWISYANGNTKISSKETSIAEEPSNSMALMLTQPKILALKIGAVYGPLHWQIFKEAKGEGGERGEYDDLAIYQGITSDYGWLFTEQYV